MFGRSISSSCGPAQAQPRQRTATRGKHTHGEEMYAGVDPCTPQDLAPTENAIPCQRTRSFRRRSKTRSWQTAGSARRTPPERRTSRWRCGRRLRQEEAHQQTEVTKKWADNNTTTHTHAKSDGVSKWSSKCHFGIAASKTLLHYKRARHQGTPLFSSCC